MRYLVIITTLFLTGVASAAEVMPPAPTQYVTDNSGQVSKATIDQLNTQLDQFERATSNQILVAVFPKMQSDSSIEDYTVRVANNWKAGGKEKKNGAILFVFIQDKKMFIVTGYGLEGALPDATCKQIIDQEIKPHFQQADYSGGIVAGVNAMIAATKGEYKGSGTTVNDGGNTSGGGVWIIIIIVVVVIVISSLRRRATMYGSGGRSSGWFWAWMLANSMSNRRSGWGGGGGFGGGGGGGGFGGGGGGFSGGGGSFGGGGAGGSW